MPFFFIVGEYLSNKIILGIKKITYLHYDNLLRSSALVSFLFCGVYKTHLNVDLCDVLLAICFVRNACLQICNLRFDEKISCLISLTARKDLFSTHKCVRFFSSNYKMQFLILAFHNFIRDIVFLVYKKTFYLRKYLFFSQQSAVFTESVELRWDTLLKLVTRLYTLLSQMQRSVTEKLRQKFVKTK